MRFREEKRLRRKDVLKAGVAAAVALALLAGGAAALHFWENDRYATGSDEVGSAVIAAPEEQKEITYDGSTYRQRSGLETYLIMGIDVKGKAVAVDSYEGGGQADVQMVLVGGRRQQDVAGAADQPRHHHEGAGTGCSGRGGGVCRRADRAGPLLRQWPGEQLREHRACRLDAAGRPAHRRIFCIQHGRRGHRHSTLWEV